MKMFKNKVGRPSNATLKRRRITLLTIIIVGLFVVAMGLFYTVRYFKSDGSSKNVSMLMDSIPVYSTGNKPTKTIAPKKSVDVDIYKYNETNGKYTSGQGMTRINVNGTWYILSAVVQNSYVSEDVRASTPSYIYITNEATGKIAAVVADYSYAHANTMTTDGNYIYIWRAKQKESDEDGTVTITEPGKLLVLKKSYVSDAVKIGGKITSNFTKKYLVYGENLTANASMASLAYDKKTGKLYASNKTNFYQLNITGSGSNAKLNYTKLFTQYHTDEHYKNVRRNGKVTKVFAMTNAGAVIYKEHLLLGRYYKNGFYGNGSKKNTIDIFKISRDSSGNIKSYSYVATYVFNDSVLSSGEIEDMEVIDDNVIAVYYNALTKRATVDGKLKSVSVNRVHYIDLQQFNYNKVKLVKNGIVVDANVVTATLYDSNGKIIGTFKPNSNGNLVVRNLSIGRYKVTITGINGSKANKNKFASSKNKTLTFDVGFYEPYKLVRFDI